MGLHNRTYWREGSGGDSFGSGRSGGVSVGLPKPTPAVKALLIANVVMFVLQQIAPQPTTTWLTVIPAVWWQLWRYVSFQFLHGGVFHILFNMLGLYFLGGYLERAWGPRRFLKFYLICGAFAGLTHVVMTFAFGWNPGVPLLGASGGVYAVIMACAILFPGIQLIILLFPVPIRFAAILFFGITFLSLLSGGASGISHAAHFGGMVLAVAWVWGLPKLKSASVEAKASARQGAWERKMRQRQANQEQIDRILDKIKNQGLASLSNKEKQLLQEATEQQRREDKRINKL